MTSSQHIRSISNRLDIILGLLTGLVIGVCLSNLGAGEDRERIEKKVDAIVTHFDITISDDE